MELRQACIFYVDGGTTHTRAWAAVGDRVIASAQAQVGARDGAREGGASALADAVRGLLVEVESRCRSGGEPAPVLAVAAGMITSAQGLRNVPHVDAPAGARDLARGARCEVLPEVGPLRIVFVPGVRTAPSPSASRETIHQRDLMRGEEALALGLVRRGELAPGGMLLSLGSHWKAVRVDADGRVAGSVSTLSGELVEVLRRHTILASSLPSEWPAELPADWLAAGIAEGRRHGLPRAAYEVRLLGQDVAGAPDDRLAFLVGATIAASEDTLLPRGRGPQADVALAGPRALVTAWGSVVRDRGGRAVVLDDEQAGAAFRAGCRAVVEALPGPLEALPGSLESPTGSLGGREDTGGS